MRCTRTPRRCCGVVFGQAQRPNPNMLYKSRWRVEGTLRLRSKQHPELDWAEPLARIERLSKQYVQRGALARSRVTVQALDEASLTIRRGTTLALIGESGSGKSTLARCLALLEQPSGGAICVAGHNLTEMAPHELFAVRN